uniref:Uncharacterized protein n=1 Tax=viral metagenome TaxID=1070528 RepID=A0A6M3KEV3_9ZZZZ
MNTEWFCKNCNKITNITKANENYRRCPKCGMNREPIITTPKELTPIELENLKKAWDEATYKEQHVEVKL